MLMILMQKFLFGHPILIILLQISGNIDAVGKAIEYVSRQLLDNLPHDSDASLANTTGTSSNSFGQPLLRPEIHPPPNHSEGASDIYQPGDFAAHPVNPKLHGSGIPGRMKPSQEVLTFRLLCPEERVGGVIGKGGTIIKTLKQETGCEIRVMEGVPDSDDRLIVISGPVVWFWLFLLIGHMFLAHTREKRYTHIDK